MSKSGYTKEKLYLILHEAIYWLAIAVLIIAYCRDIKKYSAPLVIPTPDNIKQIDQIYKNNSITKQ